MEPKRVLDVYAIPDTSDGHKKSWPKVGIAFINQDKSINVVLDLFPRFGKLNIREQTHPQKLSSKNTQGDL